MERYYYGYFLGKNPFPKTNFTTSSLQNLFLSKNDLIYFLEGKNLLEKKFKKINWFCVRVPNYQTMITIVDGYISLNPGSYSEIIEIGCCFSLIRTLKIEKILQNI